MTFPTKKVVREVSIDEIVASWLKAEWHKACYDLYRSDDIEQIIASPDISNETENRLRNSILSIDRGVMLKELPENVIWYEIQYAKEDVSRTFLINTTWCRDITRESCLLSDAARILMFTYKTNQIIQEYCQVLGTLLPMVKFSETEIVLVGRNLDDIFVVLEGNHRMVALFDKLQENSKESILFKRSFLGISSNLSESLFPRLES